MQVFNFVQVTDLLNCHRVWALKAVRNPLQMKLILLYLRLGYAVVDKSFWFRMKRTFRKS